MSDFHTPFDRPAVEREPIAETNGWSEDEWPEVRPTLLDHIVTVVQMTTPWVIEIGAIIAGLIITCKAVAAGWPQLPACIAGMVTACIDGFVMAALVRKARCDLAPHDPDKVWGND